METIASLLPSNLYHSYIIESDDIRAGLFLRTVLEERKEIEPNSIDVLFQVYDSFTIADSRDIKEWHLGRNSTEGKKVCVIQTLFINHEAQQSLLKLLEEPQEGTHFFIIVPNASLLLETIRSRTHLIQIQNTLGSLRARQFIESSVKERLDMVASIIEDHTDAEGSGALRHDAIRLLSELERELYKTFQKNKSDQRLQMSFSELSKAREYLSTPGAAVKMILEHIALVI